MKHFSIFLILLAAVSVPALGQGCGPANNYNCAYTGTDIVQTPASPFSASSPVNTVVTDSVLSHDHISRITDANTGGGLCGTNNQWNATPSGGSYDVITNTTTTLLIISCNGGLKFIVGFNPTTLATYPASPATFVSGTSCSGGITFSRINPLVAYCQQGTALYTVTFGFAASTNLCGLGAGNCPDVSVSPTWAKVLDFSTCYGGQTTNPTWVSILGIGANDSVLTESLSWAGGQGTARYTFAYTPGGGCSTFDSQGNGTHPAWYNAQGQQTVITSANATWFVHDVTTNGPWTEISYTGCVGADCTYDGSPTWGTNTSSVVMYSAVQSASGHHDYSLSYMINQENPQIYKHPMSNPSQAILIGNTSCTGECTDFHMNADVNDDTTSVLGTTAAVLQTPWLAPYRNEVIGVNMDGSGMTRFCKTYSSGQTGPTNFWAQYAIGAPSQDRRVYFFTSDMLGSLGVVPAGSNAGKNRWDVFACDISGQMNGPSAPTGLMATVQ